MKKIAILFLFLFFFISVKAQHTVSGLISDKSEPSRLLEGVAVYIPEFNLFDISKEGGTYILRNVGIGVVSIQFTRIGYKSVVRTISTKDSATVINIEMEPSSIELEEVAVTGNNTRLPDNIPYAISTFSVEELRRSGALHIMTALTYQPGIDKISMGNQIAKPVIRGLSFNRLQIYQFGTRVENQPWDDRHDLGVSEFGMEKIEVIKGPAALVYGSDAMGGALIFVDEKPPVVGKAIGDVNVAFASNTLGFDLDGGLKKSTAKGLFYSLRVGGKSQTSYIQGAGDDVQKNSEEKDFAFNSKFMSANGKGTIGVSKKWGTSKLTYSYFRQFTGIIEIEEGVINLAQEMEEQREREVEAPFQDVTTQIISSENTVITGNSRLNINLAYQLNNRLEYEPKGDTIFKKSKLKNFALKLNTVTFDVKYSSDPSKKSGFTVGTQGYFQKNENSGLLGLVPDAKTNDIGAYLLYRYDVKKWNFLAGGRFDHRTLETSTYIGTNDVDSLEPRTDFKNDYDLVNGSIGTAFHPVEELTLKLNASSGFTAPNYAQIGSYGKHEGAFRFERGDSDYLWISSITIHHCVF